MIANPSSPSQCRARESTDRRAVHVRLVAYLAFVMAGCGSDDLTAPRSAAMPAGAVHASITVTPDYTTFDKRAEFNGAGPVDYLNSFDEFNIDGSFNGQPSPWTTNGVTYTSADNLVLWRVPELGVQSAALTTDFGAPVIATFADADATTRFGASLMLIGARVPVGLVLRTNVGSYAFNLDVPLASEGQRFFGIALSKPGEHVTGFQFSVGGPGTALLLDDVAVGHVGAANTSANADPVASAHGPYVGSEGAPVALALSATDADGDALTFSWDLGDGTTGTGSLPPTDHVYADNGTYEILLAVDDGRGGVDTARTTATISNVAPSLEAFSLPDTPLALTPAGASVPVTAQFADPGALDTHTATLDCGGVVAAASEASNGTASGVCSFFHPGVYPVALTVSDDDGGSTTKLASGQVVVYDAAGGWVTGGGWVPSPSGSNRAAPFARGKLTFAFSAQYLTGSSVPNGSAELKLDVVGMDFRSTSLDWLVVDEAGAQLRGRGTLNGRGNYAFAVFAVDGPTTDAVRIRIWNRVSGAVMYDNRPGEALEANTVTVLGGGSVQLHGR